MSDNIYDVIVVGSGISGGWAAKEFCEKGLKVLLLDRGRPLEHPHYPTATLDPWQFPHRGKLTEEEKKRNYVQSRHWSFAEDNKQFYIDDTQNPYREIKRFDWVRSGVVGGRSLLWSRACYRLSDIDFEANARDGHGVDWPLRYRDLAPWYDYAEKFIGVSGSADQVAGLPDGQYLPPFEFNCVEKDVKEKIESKFATRRMIIGRTANVTRPVQGRGPCQARNLCHRGCPYGAYFSTQSSTLPAAMATGNLTLRPHSLVNAVLYDEKKNRATGVEVLDTETRETLRFKARLVFLNAGTVATAFILLNSTSSRFPQGFGNDSDQVGRNLMDHHKCYGLEGEIEGYEDKYYFGRRPTVGYIPRFRNITEPCPDFLRGYHFGITAARARGRASDELGASLKDSMSEAGGWGIDLYAFGECLPYADNRITLSRDRKDPWGRPLLEIDCAFRENEQRMHDDMVKTGRELLEAAGAVNIRIQPVMSYPGNANHEMGTARMGRDPKTSVLDAFNRVHAVPNVYVSDGSCMPSVSCVNPSLTFMALTARACDHAIGEMKRQSI